MARRRDSIHSQQANTLGLPNSDCLCIDNFLLSKWQTFAQNSRLLLSGPFRCQRKQCFNLVEHQFSIHIRKPKQEPGLADRDSCCSDGSRLSSAAIASRCKTTAGAKV